MKCPHCERENPEVAVKRTKELTIAGAGEVTSLAQKADVDVECLHCHNGFMLQFELQPKGLMIDLS